MAGSKSNKKGGASLEDIQESVKEEVIKKIRNMWSHYNEMQYAINEIISEFEKDDLTDKPAEEFTEKNKAALIEYYKNKLDKQLDQINKDMINDFDKQGYDAMNKGGKGPTHRYKGRNYKLRTGPRGGRYILVKGKVVYV